MLCGWKIVIAKCHKMHQHVLQGKIVKSNYIHDIQRRKTLSRLPDSWTSSKTCFQSSGVFWYRMTFLVRGQRKGANRSDHYQEYRRKGNCQLHSRFRLISVSHDWRQVLKLSLKLSFWSFQKPSVSFEVMLCLWDFDFCHHLDIMKFCHRFQCFRSTRLPRAVLRDGCRLWCPLVWSAYLHIEVLFPPKFTAMSSSSSPYLKINRDSWDVQYYIHNTLQVL